MENEYNKKIVTLAHILKIHLWAVFLVVRTFIIHSIGNS